MKDLIAKLEVAPEGSRELDREIAVHPDTPSCGVVKGANVNVVREAENNNPPIVIVPHYTTSLDAALTLVPEGCSPAMISWRVESITEPTDRVSASVIGMDEKKFPDGRHFVGNAATPALALTSAALKAHDTSRTEQSHP